MLHHNLYKHPSSKKYVTFVHGAGGSSTIWFKQLKAFKKHFNVLLVDLRGHGKSKKSFYGKLRSYNFEVVREDIVEVLDHLKIEKTHLIGISMGTIIIRDIAEHYPERVESMIMGGAVMKMNLRGRFLMRFGNLFKSLIPYMLLYKFFAFIILPKQNHKHSRNIFIREAKKLDQKEFKRWFALVAEVDPLLKFFRLNQIKTPSLYIMGEEDYMFLPSIEKLVKKHKNSILHIIPDCGHVVNIDRPAVFNQQSIDFIQSH
ncbi:MAG: alpha/beta hydrolase [Vicingaceae bacterium]